MTGIVIVTAAIVLLIAALAPAHRRSTTPWGRLSAQPSGRAVFTAPRQRSQTEKVNDAERAC